MWKILLNGGTELDVKWCGASDGVLWVNGLAMSIQEAAVIFSDTSKTSHIVAPGDIAHDGYTQLIHLSLNEGLIKIALRKEP